MNKRLTYFTPTYNRAHTLSKVYESLKTQTRKDFIWLIVDDGSKDNTKELVEQWKTEGLIEIQYILKENGGKHTAIDLSNEVCTTEYINCIDSDDYLSSDSTEVVYKYLDEVSNDESLCGIVSRRAHYNGTPFNESFPQIAEKLFFGELAEKYNYSQDTNLIFKTDVIKKFRFPVFSGERFVTESVFYNQFLLDYKMLAIPELLYLAEYQEDGYTAQGLKLFEKNPKGYLYALKQNAYLSKRKGCNFKNIIYNHILYYAWKSTMKIKDEHKKTYKLKFPYNIIGLVCAKTICKNIYKKQLSEK